MEMSRQGSYVNGPLPYFNAPHQRGAFGQDCRKCSFETGMLSGGIEEDCEYSFDLCFECTEAAVARTVTDYKGTDISAKSRMFAARKIASIGHSTTNPPDDLIRIPATLYPHSGSTSSILQKPIPRRANVARPWHLEQTTSTPKLISPKHSPKKEIQMMDKVHNDGHQLAAFAQDCTKCLSMTGISVICVDEDCEFSFDLCFECAPDTATTKISKSPREQNREFFRDPSTYPVFCSYSM